jgi:hypothetical protein
LLAILRHSKVRINFDKVSDELGCTARAVQERIKVLKKMAGESGGAEGSRPKKKPRSSTSNAAKVTKAGTTKAKKRAAGGKNKKQSSIADEDAEELTALAYAEQDSDIKESEEEIDWAHVEHEDEDEDGLKGSDEMDLDGEDDEDFDGLYQAIKSLPDSSNYFSTTETSDWP